MGNMALSLVRPRDWRGPVKRSIGVLVVALVDIRAVGFTLKKKSIKYSHAIAG